MSVCVIFLRGNNEVVSVKHVLSIDFFIIAINESSH